MLPEILFITGVLLTFVYFRLTKDYNYWKSRGVSYIKPYFFFGNFLEQVCHLKSPSVVQQEIYNAGKGEPYIGVIHSTMKPVLFIRDPEIIRHILAKDFPHFHDRGVSVNEKRNPLSAHLFSLEGARWRALRMKFTPAFTSGKMKNMLPIMQEVANEMLAVVGGFADRKEVVEMREIALCFTTDVTGTCAFGVQCNSLRDPKAEFRKMGNMLTKPNKPGRMFLEIMTQMFPFLGNVIPSSPAVRKTTEFFTTAISNAVKSRAEQDIQRNDFLDLLIQIRKRGNIVGNTEEIKKDAFIREMVNKKIEDFEFTDNLMAAQAFVFFLAGFETSANTMTYALIELSYNPRLQEALQKELDDYFERDGDRFTYDALMNMPLLDKVVAETLRKYPPLPTLSRIVTQRYKMPESDLVLEKGIKIFIPILSIHNDPTYYPDPERFDPERFTEDAKESRPKYVYLPFGEGPRNCIAQRFGRLEVKLGLASLLHRFSFELSPRTKYPPDMAKGAFFLLPDCDVYLHTKRRVQRPTDDL